MIVLFIYLYIFVFFSFRFVRYTQFSRCFGAKMRTAVYICMWMKHLCSCMHAFAQWLIPPSLYGRRYFFFLVLFPRIVYHYAFYIAHCVHRIYEPCAGASIAYITHCQKGSMRKRMASHIFRVSPNHGPNKCVNFPLWLINWPLHCCTHFAYMSCWSIIVCA